jgi:hypothetical protein
VPQSYKREHEKGIKEGVLVTPNWDIDIPGMTLERGAIMGEELDAYRMIQRL